MKIESKLPKKEEKKALSSIDSEFETLEKEFPLKERMQLTRELSEYPAPRAQGVLVKYQIALVV